MNRQVTIITIQRNNIGWIALFRGDPQIPNDMWLPLPFNVSATAEMVRNHLRTIFPNAAIVTKAKDRDHNDVHGWHDPDSTVDLRTSERTK